MSEIEIVKEKYQELNAKLMRKYGTRIPKKSDSEYWKIYGILQGLAFAMDKLKGDKE